MHKITFFSRKIIKKNKNLCAYPGSQYALYILLRHTLPKIFRPLPETHLFFLFGQSNIGIQSINTIYTQIQSATESMLNMINNVNPDQTVPSA